MNDEDIKRLSQGELARHIDGLESQAWLQELRSLQPHAASQDLYALGYAAGQHAAPRRTLSRWNTMTTAVLSSILSAAATVLLMWQLSPSLVGSSTERQLAERPVNRTQSVTEPQVAVPTESETVTPKRLEATVNDLDDLLPNRMHAASSSLVVPGTSSDFENGSGQIESERTRYVTQRQRWLSELTAPMAD